MAEVNKSTMSIHFRAPIRSVEGARAMEAFCNETVRLINWTLKREAADPKEFDGTVNYGWMAMPEEPGMYAVQITGAHTHQDVRKIGDALQAEADNRGFDIAITVVRE